MIEVVRTGEFETWLDQTEGPEEQRTHPSATLQDRDTLILLLCGGDKSTQQKDIEKAHELAEEYLVSKKKAEKER